VSEWIPITAKTSIDAGWYWTRLGDCDQTPSIVLVDSASDVYEAGSAGSFSLEWYADAGGWEFRHIPTPD